MSFVTDVSVCMVVKNEEECIRGCLESVKEASDIVVVDTGSEDKTRDIVAEYTSRVYDFPWVDDFAAAFNFADSKGIHAWKFRVDADERLLSTIDEIRGLIQHTDVEAYEVKMMSLNEDYCWWNSRLYQRVDGIQWNGVAHPSLSASQVKRCGIEIEYGRSINHDKDPLRTKRILLKAMAESPFLVREEFFLGREYANNEEWQQAIYWLKMFTHESCDLALLAEANLMLAKIHEGLGMKDEAIVFCQNAVGFLPEFKEAWEILYLLSGELKYKDKAEKSTNCGVRYVHTRSWLK